MKREISQTRIFQEIDLSDFYDRPPTESEKRAFAQEAIERIIDRTQSGRDIRGNQFKQYSKEYAEFKGVSRSDVDLTLFGDMLLSVQPRFQGDKVIIEIPREETDKAYGHLSGFKGHPTIKDGPKRDFFGLNREEAKTIAESVKSEVFVPETLNIAEILRAIGLEADGES